MELTEEQKITMAVAYGRVHEAAMVRAAESASLAVDVIGSIDDDDDTLPRWISIHNEAWRKLTGFRPHWEA